MVLSDTDQCLAASLNDILPAADFSEALRLIAAKNHQSTSMERTAYFGRATAFKCLGRYDEALADVAPILNLSARAWCYQQMGADENALADYSDCIRLGALQKINSETEYFGRAAVYKD